MMALISPEEMVYTFDGTFLGWRVADVAPTPFPVAKPLFWVDCSSDVVRDQFYYNSETAQILPIPVPPDESAANVIEV